MTNKEIKKILKEAKERFVFTDGGGHDMVDETGASFMWGLREILEAHDTKVKKE